MRILVIGAGAVGYSLSESLIREGHQVTVVDNDEQRHREIQERLNALAIRGNGASTELLESAGVRNQDIFIAVTDSDEVNLIACLLASKYDVGMIIARLRSPEYNTRQAKIKKEELGIDLVINPGDVVARDIRNMVTRLPGAFDVSEFAEGQILFLGYRVTEETPLCGLTLRQLGAKKGADALVMTAIQRGKRTLIPRGDDKILPDDAVYFICTARRLAAIQPFFVGRSKKERSIFIHGANRLGLAIASRLEMHYRVKIFDADRSACDAIESDLKKAIIIHSDCTAIDVLNEEGIDRCDVFIAVGENDELNVLTSLLAKHRGAKRAITLVNNAAYIDMVSSLGIDRVISSRVAAANHILRFVRRGDVLSMAKVEGNDSEVIEFLVPGTASAVGKPLRDVDFPRGAIVGGVIRGGTPIIARGDTVLHEGDRVVVFALPEAVRAVEKLLA